jgi:hypothetical protein
MEKRLWLFEKIGRSRSDTSSGIKKIVFDQKVIGGKEDGLKNGGIPGLQRL